MGPRSKSLVFALLLLTLTACGESRQGEGSARQGAPAPVILVSVDTLRSDRLPMYGYEGIETPAYDALRRDAVMVERAYAHLPLTLPSHTSMFTGRCRSSTGCATTSATRSTPRSLLSPEILGDQGWSTGAAISAYVLRASTGIARGFDSYDDEIQTVTGVELGGLQREGGKRSIAPSRGSSSRRELPSSSCTSTSRTAPTHHPSPSRAGTQTPTMVKSRRATRFWLDCSNVCALSTSTTTHSSRSSPTMVRG